MKVLISKRNYEIHSRELENMGYELYPFTTDDLKNNNVPKDADILIGAMDLAKANLDYFDNLKYMFLTSVGVDYLDKDAIKKHNITVTNNNGAYDYPIAEWVLYSLLCIEKFDKDNLYNQQNHIWKRRAYSNNLYNKRALILGTGTIAKRTAHLLNAFDTEVIGYNTNGRDVEEFKYCLSKDNLKDELDSFDYVIVALPETKYTHHFVDEAFLSSLRDGVKIINISRGGIIDEKALIKYLENKKVQAAGLDVFEKEPLEKDSKLWDMENVYVYPHISFSSEDDDIRSMNSAKKNLKALKENKDLINIVNFERGY